MSAFMIVVHAHDYIWRDKTLPLSVRLEICQMLWAQARKIKAGARFTW